MAKRNPSPAKGGSKKNNTTTLLMAVLLALLCALFVFSTFGFIKTADSRPPVDPNAAAEGVVDVDDPEDPAKDPDMGKRRWLTPELDEWYSINEDVVGWLSIPGCDIDDAVVQAADNNVYLRRTIESDDYDAWGCYFLDYINLHDTKTLFDKVSIIYGHALEDVVESDKFSKLKRYKDPDFAGENSTISFSLLEKELTFEVFAACDIPITIDYIDPNPNPEKYADTLAYMLDNSYVYMGVDVTVEDQILVLSTCTSDDNVRFVVAAKLAD